LEGDVDWGLEVLEARIEGRHLGCVNYQHIVLVIDGYLFLDASACVVRNQRINLFSNGLLKQSWNSRLD